MAMAATSGWCVLLLFLCCLFSAHVVGAGAKEFLYTSSDSHPVVEVSNLQLSEHPYLKLTRPTVVVFYAPWCPHCQRFVSTYTKIAKELSAHDVDCLAVSCTSFQKVCTSHEVHGLPGLRLWDEGKGWRPIKARSKGPVVDEVLKGLKESSGSDSLVNVKVKPPPPSWPAPKNVVTFQDICKSFAYTLYYNVPSRSARTAALDSWLQVLLNHGKALPCIDAVKQLKVDKGEGDDEEAWKQSVRDAFGLKKENDQEPGLFTFTTCSYTCGFWGLLHTLSISVAHSKEGEDCGAPDHYGPFVLCSLCVHACVSVIVFVFVFVFVLCASNTDLAKKKNKKNTHTRINSCSHFTQSSFLTGKSFGEEVVNYVKNFFPCSGCREHFVSDYSECQNTACDLVDNEIDKGRAALWLWRVHNSVTARVSDEDGRIKSSAWPPRGDCEECWGESGGEYEEKILSYLEFYYLRLNVMQAFTNKGGGDRFSHSAPGLLSPSFFGLAILFTALLWLVFGRAGTKYFGKKRRNI